MGAAEPNGMPAAAGTGSWEIRRYSAISIGISNHPWSRSFPTFVNEPRKITIKRDGAAIADPGRTHPHHGAAQHLTADARAVRSRFYLQFHRGSRQEAMARFDQRASSRHVDQPRAVSRPDACRDDAVVVECGQAPGPAAFVSVASHSCRHLPVLDS